MRRGAKDPGAAPGSKGFTLIELTILLVIMGVLLALVLPRLGDIGDANLKRSARHLTSMIRLLRDEAQAKKTVYRLRFDIQANRYWAETEVVTGDRTVEFQRVTDTISAQASLAGSTTFRDVEVAGHPDEPYIQFTPDGWVESAVIHLRDADDRDFSLFVMPLTGETELRQGYIEQEDRQ